LRGAEPVVLEGETEHDRERRCSVAKAMEKVNVGERVPVC